MGRQQQQKVAVTRLKNLRILFISFFVRPEEAEIAAVKSVGLAPSEEQEAGSSSQERQRSPSSDDTGAGASL